MATIDVGGLLARAEQAVFVLNDAGDLVFANRALGQLMGLTPNPTMTWHAGERELLAAPRDLPTGEIRRVERLWELGGKSRWLHLVFMPLRDPLGDPLGTLGFAYEGAPPLSISKALDSLVPERQTRWRHEQRASLGFEAVPARGPAMRRVLEQLRLATGSNAPVTLQGETGTGKFTLARLIHQQRFGSRGPLVALDLALLPADLQRQQFLGRFDLPDPHSPEARGLLRAEGVGSLLLINPQCLDTEIQSELLSCVQKNTLRWRVLASARQPLEVFLSKGDLLPGLHHFLATLIIPLPPLRERLEEFRDYCDTILARLRRQDLQGCELDETALALLMRHGWPGNLRELEAVLEQSVRRTRSTMILPDDLPPRIQNPLPTVNPPPMVAPLLALDQILEQVEKRLLRVALARCANNKSMAARQLRISRPRLLRRLEQLGLSIPNLANEADNSNDSETPDTPDEVILPTPAHIPNGAHPAAPKDNKQMPKDKR